MKYALTKMQEAKDGSIAVASESYATEREAMSAYHMELASALASEALVADTVALVGSDGVIYAIERAALASETD